MGERLKDIGTGWLASYGNADELVAEAGKLKGQGIASLGEGFARGIGEAVARKERQAQIAKEDFRYDQSMALQLAREQDDQDRTNLSWLTTQKENADKKIQQIHQARSMATMLSPDGQIDPSMFQQDEDAAKKESDKYGVQVQKILSRRLAGYTPNDLGTLGATTERVKAPAPVRPVAPAPAVPDLGPMRPEHLDESGAAPAPISGDSFNFGQPQPITADSFADPEKEYADNAEKIAKRKEALALLTSHAHDSEYATALFSSSSVRLGSEIARLEARQKSLAPQVKKSQADAERRIAAESSLNAEVRLRKDMPALSDEDRAAIIGSAMAASGDVTTDVRAAIADRFPKKTEEDVKHGRDIAAGLFHLTFEAAARGVSLTDEQIAQAREMLDAGGKLNDVVGNVLGPESPEAKGTREAREAAAKDKAMREAGMETPASTRERVASDKVFQAAEEKLRQAVDRAKQEEGNAEADRAGRLRDSAMRGEKIKPEERAAMDKRVADARKATDDAFARLEGHLRGGPAATAAASPAKAAFDALPPEEQAKIPEALRPK